MGNFKGFYYVLGDLRFSGRITSKCETTGLVRYNLDQSVSISVSW